MKKFYMFVYFAILLCAMISCQDQQAVVELEAMKEQVELEQQNKEIVKRWLSEVDKENFGIVDDLVAEDCLAYYGRDTLGREWLREICVAFPQSFSNSVHIVNDLIAEQDKVVARLTVEAIQTGEFMGMSGTGKQVEYDAYTLYRLKAGKIQEIWVDHNAVLGLMAQLGMEMKPKEPEK